MWFAKTRILHIGMGPQSLCVLGRASMSRTAQPGYETVLCDGTQDTPRWDALVQAVGQTLSHGAGKGTRVHVVLSNHWVQWQLVPFQWQIGSEVELQSYVALQFQEIYGARASAWQIRSASTPVGHNIPACAVDRSLLDALETTCTEHGARLCAVVPYLASSFDYWQGRIREKNFWFATVHADHVSLAQVHRGNWVGLRTQRFASDLPNTLQSMKLQLMSVHATVADSAPLFLTGTVALPAATPQWPFRTLVPESPPLRTHPQYRIALGV